MKRFQDLTLLAATGLGMMGIAFAGLRFSERPILAASMTQAAQAPAAQQTGAAAMGAQQTAPPVAVPSAQRAAATPEQDPGATVYAKRCAICHGDQREGILPAFPPLVGIKRQLNDQQLTDFIHKGKGRMPGFPKLQDVQLTALLGYLATTEVSPTSMASSGEAGGNSRGPHPSGLAEAGGALFQQNCAFCHGRDAQGGETGPDLTRSQVVLTDVNGDKISPVVREGRLDKKMPAFNFSSPELLSLVAFIHFRETAAKAQKGGRRGVDVADLQTGNLDAGKRYFNGAGGCAKCHSPTGDLAGIATRYEGLRLEERMLYPRDAKSTVTVTLPSGKKMEGTLAYKDEFTIGLQEKNKTYHSWPTDKIKFVIDSPVEAHIEQFPKYSDDDVHNLMAYLQTLK